MPKPIHLTVQRMFRWKYFYIVNLCLVIFVSVSLGREFIRTHEIQSQIKSLQTQSDALQTKNLEIAQLQTSVQTESFIEREARLKLGLKKPGESVVILKENESNIAIDGTKTNTSDPLGMVLGQKSSPTKLANSTKWWYYFFHKQAYLDLLPYESRL